MALLEIENLQTHFRTRDGVNRAVDGVSFTVEAGETLRQIRYRELGSAPDPGTARQDQRQHSLRGG
jgi:ABC-type microcin C transport system duplicated ATPase subunit YejF